MIRVSEVDYHISLFPEDTICEGVTRKYIEFNKTRLYLHPGDPRFGASLDGILYSFRRPMGARGTENREAGVSYSKPRLLKGHKNYRGTLMITITPYDKRSKAELLNEIYRDRNSKSSSVVFLNGNENDFSADNMRWSS